MIGLYDENNARLPLDFDGYIFNQNIDGNANHGVLVDRHLVTQEFASTNVPKQVGDGSEVYGARKIGKIISLWGFIKAPNMRELSDLVDNFAANFDPALLSFLDTATGVGVATLTFTNLTAAGPNYLSFVQCRPITVPAILWDRYTGDSVPFRLDLFCPDPRRYHATASNPTVTGAANDIVNAGNYPTYPTWTITTSGNGASNFQIENITRGEILQLNLSAVGAATIIVYPVQKAVSVNGVLNAGIAAFGTEWWQLAPGINSVRRNNNTNITSCVGAFNSAFSL